MATDQEKPAKPELELTITATFTNCWNYFKDNLGMYVSLFALSIVPFFIAGVLAAGGLLEAYDERTETFNSDELNVGLLIAAGVMGLIGTVVAILVNAAVVASSLQIIREGKKLTFSEAWKLGRPHWGRVFIVGLVMGLIIIAGFIAFIVPGLIFLTWYYVAMVAAVDNQTGVGESLRESKRLTEGKRWWIFGLIFITGLLSGGLGNIPLLGQIASMIVSVLATIFVPYVYLGLKQAKDGSTKPTSKKDNPAPTGKTEIPA